MSGFPFKPKARNPHLSGFPRRNAIASDICPECGGALDTGWECNDCGFDARDEAMALPEMNFSGPSPNDRTN